MNAPPCVYFSAGPPLVLPARDLCSVFFRHRGKVCVYICELEWAGCWPSGALMIVLITARGQGYH